MRNDWAFNPMGNALEFAATASNQNVALPAYAGEVILIDNTANAAPFVFSTSTDAATDVTTTFQATVGAGYAQAFWIGRNTRIAGRLTTGSGTVYISRGNGKT